jgi:hypothetical protein
MSHRATIGNDREWEQWRVERKEKLLCAKRCKIRWVSVVPRESLAHQAFPFRFDVLLSGFSNVIPPFFFRFPICAMWFIH